VCYCTWCAALVLLDVVGSGCGALRCRVWALWRCTSRTVTFTVMPETCWEIIDNKHLTVASCWFSLSLPKLKYEKNWAGGCILLEWCIMRTLFFQNRHEGNAARRLIIKRIPPFRQPPDYWRRNLPQEYRDLFKKIHKISNFLPKIPFKINRDPCTCM